MLIPIRPILVGAILIASNLGDPGQATGESTPGVPDALARTISDTTEDRVSVRAESAIGLAGDLDPASMPVKQHDLADSSVAPPEPVFPPAAVYSRPPVPSEPSPVADTSPVADKAVAMQRYELEDNHHVRQFVDQFHTGHRRTVIEKWLARSGQYLPMILDVFRQKGLPDELVFTAMIESGFNPVAVSRAGAKGLWQFMAPTARRYGLRIDEWLDERLDPEKSTVAAARHLLDLYAVFGSWNLVQAAYNAGEMRVLEAIRAMGTSDFWKLRSGPVLRDETKNFVPAIKAATIIAKEPERYGFVVPPAEPLSYEIVSVPPGTSLGKIATSASLPLEELERLNPELKLKQTPPDGPYALKVPVESARSVRAALERDSMARPPLAVTVHTLDARGATGPSAVHVVQPQETVAAIARRYGVTVADLTRWNNLGPTGRIRPGERLRIAAGPRERESQVNSR
jgi:membrane-bound lytic murein transglycosylase D